MAKSRRSSTSQFKSLAIKLVTTRGRSVAEVFPAEEAAAFTAQDARVRASGDDQRETATTRRSISTTRTVAFTATSTMKRQSTPSPTRRMRVWSRGARCW